MDASILITLSNDVFTVKEARAKLRERALITSKINSLTREYCCRNLERGEGREKENETHKKCIILRKNGQEKVISKRNCRRFSDIFFFLQFNEMRILLSKSRKKKQK